MKKKEALNQKWERKKVWNRREIRKKPKTGGKFGAWESFGG